MTTSTLFTASQLNIIDFCAKECAHQKSGEISVGHMARALTYAYERRDSTIAIDDVLALGALVEPDINETGYRLAPVRFANGTVLTNQEAIPQEIWGLVTHGQSVLSPEAFYEKFERIHPFRDGNGRVGVILYNWLKQSLGNPEIAPAVSF